MKDLQICSSRKTKPNKANERQAKPGKEDAFEYMMS